MNESIFTNVLNLSQVGKSYNVRESTFADYVSELRRKTKRSLSSYMAVQNIKNCFPQLQVYYDHIACELQLSR